MKKISKKQAEFNKKYDEVEAEVRIKVIEGAANVEGRDLTEEEELEISLLMNRLFDLM